ncbi:hypothetical protein LshimejAT787_0504710 [Lyophyllum shimeji]|uniref:Uncharacterized protein n=1 Tax=Lyophyllum shimeji TaxID=47721 RepID=A0A9P3UPU0_LYOSH|nr:hypothetical protein LshimejAT787_0504710 [Lyophyllum shimeji]
MRGPATAASGFQLPCARYNDTVAKGTGCERGSEKSGSSLADPLSLQNAHGLAPMTTITSISTATARSCCREEDRGHLLTRAVAYGTQKKHMVVSGLPAD